MKELESVLKKHAKRYPRMEPTDAVKLLYQNEFGGGHLIRDVDACLRYLRAEYESVPKDPAATRQEYIGNGIYRVNLAALTEAELSLAETILEYEDFRNALNHDLVDNTTAFTLAETASIVGAVIPQEAEVSQIAVSGAVVVIDYSLPYQRVILQYADADRSGTVDQIHKTLEPIISGVTTGCYTVEKNLSTDKIVYTHTSY